MTETKPDSRVIAFPSRPEAKGLEERPDDDLMLLSVAGRKDAFGVLVGRHLPKLSNYCAKFVGNGHAGEDLAQEAFVQAWAHRAAYRPEGRLRLYLLTLARNLCRNHLRNSARRTSPAIDFPIAAPGPNPDDALIELERRKLVFEGMQRLPPKLREAVLLRFDQGLEYADIARLIARPEATARSRVFLGLRRLRAEIGKGALS